MQGWQKYGKGLISFGANILGNKLSPAQGQSYTERNTKMAPKFEIYKRVNEKLW